MFSPFFTLSTKKFPLVLILYDSLTIYIYQIFFYFDNHSPVVSSSVMSTSSVTVFFLFIQKRKWYDNLHVYQHIFRKASFFLKLIYLYLCVRVYSVRQDFFAGWSHFIQNFKKGCIQNYFSPMNNLFWRYMYNYLLYTPFLIKWRMIYLSKVLYIYITTL